MPNQDVSEKRAGVRVDFETEILLRVEGEEIREAGSSRDLSLKGAYIKTGKEISVGSKCEVEVCLTGMVEKVSLKMEGVVARKDSDGVGISFNSIDLDSYTHLKNIVRYNVDDPDNIA